MFFADVESDGAPLEHERPAQGQHRYRCIEISADSPLWHVEVLQVQTASPCADRRHFLLSNVQDALDKIAGLQWGATQIHVMLPKHLTGQAFPLLARCSAILEGRIQGDPHRPCWIFETDMGLFADPVGSELIDFPVQEGFGVRWRDED